MTFYIKSTLDVFGASFIASLWYTQIFTYEKCTRKSSTAFTFCLSFSMSFTPYVLCLCLLNQLPANWSWILWIKQQSDPKYCKRHFRGAFRSTRVIHRQTVSMLRETVSQTERQTMSTHKHSNLMWQQRDYTTACVSFKWLSLCACQMSVSLYLMKDKWLCRVTQIQLNLSPSHCAFLLRASPIIHLTNQK